MIVERERVGCAFETRARAPESWPSRVAAAHRGLPRNGGTAARERGNRRCVPAGGSSSGRGTRESAFGSRPLYGVHVRRERKRIRGRVCGVRCVATRTTRGKEGRSQVDSIGRGRARGGESLRWESSDSIARDGRRPASEERTGDRLRTIDEERPSAGRSDSTPAAAGSSQVGDWGGADTQCGRASEKALYRRQFARTCERESRFPEASEG